MIGLAEATLLIDAPRQRVFELFTTEEGLCSWMASDADVDLRPGGSWRWTHDNGVAASGTYLRIEPYDRLAFTYGWESGPYAEMPPGSTNVEILFDSEGGNTRVTVRHTTVPTAFSDAHAAGWAYFLGVLRNVASGAPIPSTRIPSDPKSPDPTGPDIGD